MGQKEILDRIKANPGVLQKELRKQYPDGKMFIALFKKRIVRAEWIRGNNHLYWTGVEL